METEQVQVGRDSRRHVYRTRNVLVGVAILSLFPALLLWGLVSHLREGSGREVIWVFGGALAVLGLILWRLARVGVVVTRHEYRLRNFLRTRRLRRDDIDEFVVGPTDGPVPGEVAYAVLRDGQIVKAEGLCTTTLTTRGERASLDRVVARLNAHLTQG